MSNRISFVLIVSLTMLNSCNNWTIDKEAVSNFHWKELTDTSKLQVYYIQLNFLNYPDENYIGKSIIDFVDSIETNSFLLNSQQRTDLLKLINDTSNYSGGDCGTFHLNAGFIIADKNKIMASIDIGCAFNQWVFTPYNSNYGGSFNEKGFKEIEKLLDNINLTKKKK